MVCFVQAKTFCGYGCIYFLAALLLVDVMVGDVICVVFPNRCIAKGSVGNDITNK